MQHEPLRLHAPQRVLGGRAGRRARRQVEQARDARAAAFAPARAVRGLAERPHRRPEHAHRLADARRRLGEQPAARLERAVDGGGQLALPRPEGAERKVQRREAGVPPPAVLRQHAGVRRVRLQQPEQRGPQLGARADAREADRGSGVLLHIGELHAHLRPVLPLRIDRGIARRLRPVDRPAVSRNVRQRPRDGLDLVDRLRAALPQQAVAAPLDRPGHARMLQLLPQEQLPLVLLAVRRLDLLVDAGPFGERGRAAEAVLDAAAAAGVLRQRPHGDAQPALGQLRPSFLFPLFHPAASEHSFAFHCSMPLPARRRRGTGVRGEDKAVDRSGPDRGG